MSMQVPEYQQGSPVLRSALQRCDRSSAVSFALRALLYLKKHAQAAAGRERGSGEEVSCIYR